MIQLVLPWPVSANRAWRNVRGRTVLSREAREYRTQVGEVVATARRRGLCGQAPLQERLHVRLDAYPPDRRRRDLDNIRKVLLDALTHAAVWLDDSQIDHDEAVRWPMSPDAPQGAVLVTVTEIAQQAAA